MTPYSQIRVGQQFFIYFNDAVDEGDDNRDFRIMCERRAPTVCSNCVADGWNLEDDLPMEIEADTLVEPISLDHV